MNTRERWIVYPLVFLAMGLAMRNKVIPPSELLALRVKCHGLDANEITCNSFTVKGLGEKDVVRIMPMKNGSGRLEIRGKGGQNAIVLATDPSGQFGVVEMPDGKGNLQLLLQASPEGGRLTTLDPAQKLFLITGYQGSEVGMFALPIGSEKGIRLTLPLRLVEQNPDAESKPDAESEPADKAP
jgi:hypothetical protein